MKVNGKLHSHLLGDNRQLTFLYAMHTLHTKEGWYKVDTESVYRQLREQIVSGVYRAGDRLPEVSLSTALAVSRTPVREALRRLESDGLVQASGRGVVVTAMSTPDLRHAHAVRGALDALTAELAADRRRAG